EDTLLSCSGNKIYKHRGISPEIDSYFEVFDIPVPNFTGLTIANNNLISCDDAGNKIRVHSGISAIINSSFPSPASNPSGLYYDGIDLWSCDKGTSKIYHHSGISATITENFDSPGKIPTGLSCDNAKNLISGNCERYGRFIAERKTINAVNKEAPQICIYNNMIYLVWHQLETYGRTYVAKMNLDRTAFSVIKIIDTAYTVHFKFPQFSIVNDKIYGVTFDYIATEAENIHSFIMNLDGSGYSMDTIWSISTGIYELQFQIYENTKYYLITYNSGGYRQIALGVLPLSSLSGLSAVTLTTSSVHKYDVQFHIYNNKIYYVWVENNHIWVATSQLDRTGFFAVQKTSTSFERAKPQLQVKDNKIYYIWQQKDALGIWQLWTAVMNIDGTEWEETKRSNTLTHCQNPQLLVGNDGIYYVFQFNTGSYNQIYTATISLDDIINTFIGIERTNDSYHNITPQFQRQENNIYYVWIKQEANHQIWSAITNLGTIFVHKQKSSLIDRSYITSDNIDDIYYDGTNLISCDITAKKITIYDGISNTIKNSFTISHESYGLSFASIVKTSNLQVDICDFAILNDTLIIVTGKKWLLRWTGSGNLISNVPTTSFQQFPVIKYCKVFKNVAIGVDINNPSRLKWCFWNMPDTWYDSSYIDIDKDNGEIIKGLSLFRNDLIVFKENYLYKVSYTGDAMIPFIYDKIDNVGTVGHKTVVLVEGLLYFIAKDGIYIFDGVLSKKISFLIPNTFARFLSQHYDKIVAIDVKSLHQIWWTIPEPEIAGNATVLIYDYFLNCFWTSCQKEANYFSCFEFVSNEYLAGGAKSAAYIYKLNEGDTADDSAYFAGIFYSKRLDFGLPNKWKQVRKIFLDVKASGNYNLGIAVKVDDGLWSTEKTISLLNSQER
ncbi:MAG: hypothetical protein AB1765_12915, partial [Candidatus Hydrogenedentota bacterium]